MATSWPPQLLALSPRPLPPRSFFPSFLLSWCIDYQLAITRRTDRGVLVRTLGSRELLRYYRQMPRPSPARDIARAISLASRYETPHFHGSLSWKTAYCHQYFTTISLEKNNVCGYLFACTLQHLSNNPIPFYFLGCSWRIGVFLDQFVEVFMQSVKPSMEAITITDSIILLWFIIYLFVLFIMKEVAEEPATCLLLIYKQVFKQYRAGKFENYY